MLYVNFLISFIIILSGILNSLAVRCRFCNNDFQVIGRHVWRCKSRLGHDNQNNDNNNHQYINESIADQPVYLDNIETHNCICGKSCKGRRGLAAHQRSCKLLIQLNLVNNNNRITNDELDIGPINTDDQPFHDVGSTLPGVKLPKTEDEWKEANLFFHAHLHTLPNPGNVSEYADSLQSMIYDYFKTSCGVLKSRGKEKTKYDGYSANKLRATLKRLKQSNDNLDEIRIVSRLLRQKLREKTKHQNEMVSEINNYSIIKNFWKTCKHLFDKLANIKPTFTVVQAQVYFENLFNCSNRSVFTWPEWFVPPQEITIPFDSSSPTYIEVATIINRLRNNSAPCPLDQIQTLMLKKCPILKTAVQKLIVECWNQQRIPDCWKRAVTILIHKKGQPDDPSNFRPITLQPVLYKVYSGVLRNRLTDFLTANDILDTKTQKGFIQKCDGVSEHSELFTHILSDAKRYQRSIAVATLDLRNAFGEVNHKLIFSSLSAYKVPTTFINIFKDIYLNYNLKFAVNDQLTNNVPVKRGVLQGDPSSPLLFNLCFNSLMTIVNQDVYRQHGYTTRLNQRFFHINWLQFADDALAIAKSAKSLQILLNVFVAWCQWADMKIRIDKCTAFGMRKFNNAYKQYEPFVTIQNEQMPVVQEGESFKYLGKVYNADNDLSIAKVSTKENLETMLKAISNLCIKAQLKIKILHLIAFPKLSFTLKSYNFPATWITQELDSVVRKYVRFWMELPISANIDNLLLPYAKGGINLSSIKNYSDALQLSKRYNLKNSRNFEINCLFKETSHRNISIDEILLNSNSLAESKRKLTQGFNDHIMANIESLKIQGSTLISLQRSLSQTVIKRWSNRLQTVSEPVFNFVRKALIGVLPTNSQLCRWGRIASGSCPLCNAVQTNKHVLSNCSSEAALNRYKLRHDCALRLFCHWLKSVLPSNAKLCVDLPNDEEFEKVDMFNTYRPDIAVVFENKVVIGELTICNETNLESSKQYKLGKYMNLQNDLVTSYQNCNVLLHTIEFTVLGFVSSCDKFLQTLNLQDKVPSNLEDNISKNIIYNSFNIYLNRNSA